MVCYDRVFEALNLATEMVSGVEREMSFLESVGKIWNFRENQLGAVYVKYLNPINLNDYLEHHNEAPLQPEKINPVALKLTRELLMIQ